MNSVVTKDKPFEGYHYFNYIEDRYEEDKKKQQKVTHQAKLNESNAGKEQRTLKSRDAGRRVRSFSWPKLAV